MSKFDLDNLFKIAIDREIEAYEFYKAAAGRMPVGPVKDIFLELSREEQGHRDLLTKFRQDPALKMKISAPEVNYKIAESTPLPLLSIELKPADAIALAMKKEQMAVDFYNALAAAATDAELQSVLTSLSNMELGHKQRLENMFVNIGYPESF